MMQWEEFRKKLPELIVKFDNVVLQLCEHEKLIDEKNKNGIVITHEDLCKLTILREERLELENDILAARDEQYFYKNENNLIVSEKKVPLSKEGVYLLLEELGYGEVAKKLKEKYEKGK